MEPFESAWLKWGQAVVNADVLRDSVVTLAGQPDLKLPSTYATLYDAKRHCLRLMVLEISQPFPVLWGLLLGDIVHNYRSCLDHIAWALYKRGKTPDLPADKERNVYFPIAKTRESFNKSLRRKLPGVRRADIAIVRRYQPYKPGKTRAHRHVFAVLDGLANADKHRTIQPVVGVLDQIGFDSLRLIDCDYLRRITTGPDFTGLLEPGTELARFYVRKTGPDPRIDVQPRFRFTPAIHDRLTLVELLEQTMKATGIVLREFSEPPQSVRSLLGPLMPTQD